MPVYEFVCSHCNTRFEKLVRSMSSSQSDEAAPCPKCDSKKTARTFSAFAVSTSAPSSPATTGGMCGCGKTPGSCGMG